MSDAAKSVICGLTQDDALAWLNRYVAGMVNTPPDREALNLVVTEIAELRAEIGRMRSVLSRTQMDRYSIVSASAGVWRCHACGGAPVPSPTEHDMVCDPKRMAELHKSREL